MKKNPEQTAKTRRAITEAFFTLYAQKPIERINVSEVVTLAGYNRSTFYEYFASVYDLLERAEDELIGHIREVHKDESVLELGDIQALYDLFENNELAMRALLGPYGQLRFLERVKAEFKSYFEPFSKRYDAKLAPYVVEYCISTSVALFNLWQKNAGVLSAEELFSLIESLRQHGLSSLGK